MTIHIITAHPAARDYVLAELINEPGALEMHTKVEDSFFETLNAGDKVYGSLPVNLAARVCAAGAEYHHLTQDFVPPEWRGRVLEFYEFLTLNPQIKQFKVTAV